MEFKELKLREELLRILEKRNFSTPTEIQEKAIPVFLDGQNIFGKSGTGTGKTATFVLPILQNIDTESKKVQAVILAPTRELALQILETINILSSHIPNLKTASLIGGMGIVDQIKKVKISQIVVGTPGRVADHLNRKTLNTQNVKTVILDEADEMLKMGFKNEIDLFFKSIEQKVQVGLFSATTTPKVLELAQKYMGEYTFVEIKNEVKVNDNINSEFVYTTNKNKEIILINFFMAKKPKKAIVFTNTKSHTEKIAKNLNSFGFKSVVINGDKKQSQRSASIRRFKSEEFNVLVATDVVGRGIDIDDVDFVINYDIPKENEQFIHRIGRTGRNNKMGDTISFVSTKEALRQVKDIQKHYQIKIHEITDEEFMKEIDESLRIAHIEPYESRDFRRGDDRRNSRGRDNGRNRNFSKSNDWNKNSRRRDGYKKKTNNDSEKTYARKSRNFEDKENFSSKESFGDKPKRSYGDKPRSRSNNNFGDKPKRSYGDKPRSKSSENFSDKPKRSYGDKPKSRSNDNFKNKPKRNFDEKPRFENSEIISDKPKRRTTNSIKKKNN
ncbi:DEAD-box ATP-dependent RNA helicase [Williamsoniiplasma somnilux]|uniref:DEAD-box ATP-dependent RNA helicase n=1 Tax=Williamsoniiplasma somnilux TaxID=215578 RepID=A0A2K8NYK3_9MOLU|nr:DEAD/DEAH box helicase [Williamsoniiplasma somnilux]ATZ18899.1 DEAD-box ATP-dependent RNA helicase [Williamsoniiplasma somnilux]